ncbi:MAG: hypothetical protein JXA77_07425 [Bacteroidales bacterium]|nr:hypothetical protein [Bacteroidales bacterium]MBN2819707.1 hypothetical protein [Bacteroidales bacterium]
MIKSFKNISFYILILAFILKSCSEGIDVNYADGYPYAMAGNWVVFEFQGGDLDGHLSDPYDMSTALAPNDDNMLVINNLYNSDTRIKVPILNDTGFFAYKTDQLEVINMGRYDIHKISIEGYIQENFILTDFIYSLAEYSFKNIAFTADDIDEILFFRAGYYDAYDALVDTVLVFGYRKTGFEDVDYKK